MGMGQTSSGVPHHAFPRVSKSCTRPTWAATLARDLRGLTGRWDEDAVLLQPGQAPIVGKAAFEEFVKQNFAKSPLPSSNWPLAPPLLLDISSQSKCRA
jgi:hypothetical protein